MEHRIEIQGERETLARIRTATGTPEQRRRFFVRAGNYMRQVTGQTFAALRNGGTYRGVTWPYFAPQYTRKTDGVTVPAWGGVPHIGQYSWISEHKRANQKARGEKVDRTNKNRLVKGRKRPSGKRIKEGDALMQDTGTMRRSVVTAWDIARIDDRRAEFGTGLRYAPQQQARRLFLFFEPGVDIMRITRIFKQSLKQGGADGGPEP